MNESSTSFGWTECRTHENYPVIGLVFSDGAEKFTNVVLFDSGSDATYVASELIKREGLEDDDAIVAADEVNGFLLARYVLPELSIQLTDGVHARTGNTDINVVLNWTSSAFGAGCAQSDCVDRGNLTGVCPFRAAVVSSTALADLEVGIILDGRSRTTTFHELSPSDAHQTNTTPDLGNTQPS